MTVQEALVALRAVLKRAFAYAFPAPVRIEVLVADPKRRAVLERQLRDGMVRLRRVYGENLPERLAVLARYSADAGGTCHSELGTGDARLTVIRLALGSGGRESGADEVLAALAEQVHAIASGRALAPAIIRRPPAEPVPAGAPAIRVLDDPDADPLAMAG
ncbi:MAG: hypothetical protein M3P51_15375 [Chloroflexota bacterium]|nr:hypothetical protein [Chloroflexota bacterium]